MAIQLAWFLTATRRPLRDRATKALVAVLADRPGLALSLWTRFRTVDDGYVTERVLASLYGAAMQGRWDRGSLSKIALQLYEDLFKDGRPPTNTLLRDHGAGLISYAHHHGCAGGDIDAERLRPPFESPWPIEYVADDTIESYVCSYGDGGSGRDEIVMSCIDGDFGRYVLDPAVHHWSPAPIGTVELPTVLDLRRDWLARFSAAASDEMMAAYDRLVATLEREHPTGSFAGAKQRDAVKEAKAAFLEAVGSDVFEEWRAYAENWRADGMYQGFARSGPAEFNLAWSRRWVVMRAHNLGWTEELHSDFDRGVRGDRHSHDVERIGKKYQWLALYELVARMEDNLARVPHRDPDRLRLRNLDPSLLITRTSDNGWKDSGFESFWTGRTPALTAASPAAALAWLHSDEDILDGMDVVAVKSSNDERDWLALTGFETWSRTVPGVNCEAWRRVSCLVIRACDLQDAIALLSERHLTSDNDFPTAEGGGYRVHLGEFPWQTLNADHDEWFEDWMPFGADERIARSVPVLSTTAEYTAEHSSYDGSISDNIKIHLPARWIIWGLGLRLTDGQSILYRDGAGVVRFWDPSVSNDGRSVGLVDRDSFLGLLTREGLVAVWAVAGEKNAYAQDPGNGFGGRFIFSRLYCSRGDEILQLRRFATYDAPSEEQLREFLDGDDDGA